MITPEESVSVTLGLSKFRLHVIPLSQLVMLFKFLFQFRSCW